MVSTEEFTASDLGAYLILVCTPFEYVDGVSRIGALAKALDAKTHIAGRLEEIADEGVWIGRDRAYAVVKHRVPPPAAGMVLGGIELEQRCFVPYASILEVRR